MMHIKSKQYLKYLRKACKQKHTIYRPVESFPQTSPSRTSAELCSPQLRSRQAYAWFWAWGAQTGR